ncbi:type III secretion system inner membrane ring lipoprotein SctJ [Burkholderia diffusa]|uniref:type III secretion system inner membrane ring lipoprotein SctJ n=1 Tax=Burkholderia diffusa TaxID=488732 RepID=UPI000AD7021D|nr:type III secretion inner membrane ring lipoprotein SctJ [Burkholderia diffusa]
MTSHMQFGQGRRTVTVRRFSLIAVLCAAMFLAGCKVTIHSQVSEGEANSALAVLLDAGIDAEKVAAEEKSFDVQVGDADVSRALDVLHAHGLPREHYADLGELFKKQGLVSTPAEERVRYIYGVSQELEHTISQIDGVVVARVHVVIPANDPLADQKMPSSASVFIKYRPSANPTALAPVVRSLVMRSIEGLDADHIGIAFVVADPSPASAPIVFTHLLGVHVDTASQVRFACLLVAPWLVVALLLALLMTRFKQACIDELEAVRKWADGVWNAMRFRLPQAGKADGEAS